MTKTRREKLLFILGMEDIALMGVDKRPMERRLLLLAGRQVKTSLDDPIGALLLKRPWFSHA
jgi:hypothetical protein